MTGISAIVLIIPLIIVLAVYLVCRKSSGTRLSTSSIILDISLILYMFFLIAVLCFPLEIYEQRDLARIVVNLVPFKEIGDLLSEALETGDKLVIIKNLVGNYLLFAPLALYDVIRFAKKNKTHMTWLVIISMSAEILQFLLVCVTGNVNRRIDITDMILNVTGCLVTWWIMKHCVKKTKSR